ncbi:peptidoglycan D,D-transpeptidase FtsI family protein [Lichenihabitans sp. PAMC28606]|uniref:peptidoglycan D,D-transpeptidase FtsI family protein n=1 Tax=Lichenihabitans sp. PAMC28606 TaxID=2880932 RepID=UPI0039B59109
MAESNVDFIEPDPAGAPKSRMAQFLADVMRTRLDKSSSRLRLVAIGFIMVFGLISGKLVLLGFKPDNSQSLKGAAAEAVSGARPDILDRNGAVMATDIKTMSVFAEPRRIIDKDEAVELLTAVLPDVDAHDLRDRLGSRKGFVWVKRGITPSQQAEVYHLGLPGIGFLPENRRVYPNGPIAAHVLGFANLDNQGIAGIEKYIDGQGLADLHGAGFKLSSDDLKPITLSIDLNATHAMRDELAKGIEHFKAKSGAAAIMNVNTGEMIAFASLPDYDPNNPAEALNLDPNHINHLTVGVYEMGSTFKAISIAMALEANKVTLNSKLDARDSLRYGRFTIHDFHNEGRFLTVPEVFKYSSNVGTARMAMLVGIEGHQAFLKKMGQFDRLRTELPENAMPLIPKPWSELNTITAAFGQGLNVAPLQAMMAVAGLVNGGYLIKPTFLRRDSDDVRTEYPRVVRPEVSEELRYLMRLNAAVGSAKKINIPGYFAGGKTGTADKIIHGRYAKDKVFTTFMSIMPADKPKYLFLVLMDDPQAVPGTYGFHTAAWNSGEVCGKIMARVAPILDMPPNFVLPQQPFPYVAKLGIGLADVMQP